MTSLRFLTLNEVLLLHHDQIEHYGGSHGLRDSGLLESALAQPQAGFGDQYVHVDVYEMAAAYLYHLVQNHPFHDGNKRIGAYAAIVFLYLNGIQVGDVEAEFEALVFSTAQGQTKKQAISEFFRKNTRATP